MYTHAELRQTNMHTHTHTPVPEVTGFLVAVDHDVQLPMLTTCGAIHEAHNADGARASVCV